ncbi:Lysine exporter protein (LYSE/YGGA) [Thermodesulfatator indicus DSM 15286]|uniref:Lysine exporter protein (LYSE/YGGA) n=1 Tax=Thermodesulfatator indicus (strain DSM 15286 / JCM 11887 / CIR29812) TaxID=667014 RepID=F8A881_THEID|nr:LysE family transporter [Thermodesulfatator indicus]AEH44476.1 Lysine exporter protein (LYSE/YGGA) [Thermodesulfatator indicus DSM 15286]
MGSTTQKDYKKLLLLTFTITPSGAISPGPLSAFAVAMGASIGIIGGFLIATGHLVVELLYLLLLYKFYQNLDKFLRRFKFLFNLIITTFLAYFAYLLVKDGLHIFHYGLNIQTAGVGSANYLKAFSTGIILTGLNVYFLLWWLSVGKILLEESAKIGWKGFLAMFSAHISIDYIWLMLLAGGGIVFKLIGYKAYASLLLFLGTTLVYFAIKIALDTFSINLSPRKVLAKNK